MALLRETTELLDGWPPKPAEIFSGYGFFTPTPAEIELIGVVLDEESATITLHGRHARGGCRYRLEVSDEDAAAELRRWFHRRIGSTMLELGNLEVNEAPPE